MSKRPYEAMVERVLAAAARHADAFSRKAFIADVAAELRLPLPELKRWLLVARDAGDIGLARCDLVEGFDAEIVAASELAEGRDTYHFVRVW